MPMFISWIKGKKAEHVITDFGLHELEIGNIYAAWIFSIIKPFIGNKILELGSGIGAMIPYYKDCPFVIVSDINREYLKIIKKRYRENRKLGVIRLDITEITAAQQRVFIKQNIDSIIAINVLEHIKDDLCALKNINRILSSGRLILFVPALPIIYGSLDEAFGHQRRYGKDELIRKIERAGFEIEFIKYFNLMGIIWWYLIGSIIRMRNLSRQTGYLLRVVVPLLRRIESVIPIPIGQSLIVVAKKKRL